MQAESVSKPEIHLNQSLFLPCDGVYISCQLTHAQKHGQQPRVGGHDKQNNNIQYVSKLVKNHSEEFMRMCLCAYIYIETLFALLCRDDLETFFFFCMNLRTYGDPSTLSTSKRVKNLGLLHEKHMIIIPLSISPLL